MPVRKLTEPAYLPVALAEARRWVKAEEDEDTHDVEILRILRAFVGRAEHLTGRAFIPRTLELVLPGWPWDAGYAGYAVAIKLPHPPLVRVEAVRYVDTAGAVQVLAPGDYVAHDWRAPACIVPAWGTSWPLVRAVADAVRVEYVAGYRPIGSPEDEAAHQAAVPDELKLWLQANLGTHFEHRETLVAGAAVNALPRAHVDGLLDDLVLGERIV